MAGGTLTPFNLTQGVNDSVPDKGYWEDIPLSLTAARTNANPPAILTGATTPTIALASNEVTIAWAATVTAGIVWEFGLPGQAAKGVKPSSSTGKVTGAYQLVLSAKCAGTTDETTGIFAATLYARAPGGALKGSFAATFKRVSPTTGAVASTTSFSENPTNPDMIVMDWTSILASGSTIEAGDQILITLAPGTHGTDAIQLTQARFRYRRNHALTNRYFR